MLKNSSRVLKKFKNSSSILEGFLRLVQDLSKFRAGFRAELLKNSSRSQNCLRSLEEFLRPVDNSSRHFQKS